VADEDVTREEALSALLHERRRARGERDHAAVGVDRRAEAVEVTLLAGAADADAAGRPRDAVPHEDVVPEVRVLQDEVPRERTERDVPAVGAHDTLPAGVVA